MTGGTVGVVARKRRERPPEAPPRPTVEDVDAWLAQIDQVLEDSPEATRKGEES